MPDLRPVIIKIMQPTKPRLIALKPFIAKLEGVNKANSKLSTH